MPPDRTEKSAPSPLSLPLSSHGGHSSLERGKACTTCKRRKIKCSGTQPCASCIKSGQVHGRDPASIECIYIEPAPPGPRATQSKVASLEAKIAELEAKLTNPAAPYANLPPPPPPVPSSMPSIFQQPYTSTPTWQNFGSQAQAGPSNSFASYPSLPSLPNYGNASSSTSASLDPLLAPSGSNGNFDAPMFNLPDSLPSVPSFASGSTGFGIPSPNQNSATAHTTPSTGASPMSDALLELLWPGWPSDLPSPNLVNRLIEVYFAKLHVGTGMINEGKFLSSMMLPPTNARFPHKSLLHAMLATSSKMVSVDWFKDEDMYWLPYESPTDYHAAKAMAEINTAFARGERIFQLAQALNLTCYYSYTSARFLEVWMYTALVTRMSGPLGLNHVRARKPLLDHPNVQVRRMSLLADTDDPDELFERAATFWISYASDCFACASTSWPSSIDDADVSSLLPAPPGAKVPTDPLEMAASPLSIHNPSFFISHPRHLVGKFQLYLKACVLLGHCVKLRSRFPEPIGHSIQNISLYSDFRLFEGFRRAEQHTIDFANSIPREFSSYMLENGSPEAMLLIVHSIPAASMILLHENFVTTSRHDKSFEKCMVAARHILAITNNLWASSFDIAFLAPFINACWSIAGRTLVRELALRQTRGEKTGNEQLVADIRLLIAAMHAYKSPLGEASAMILEGHLAHPQSVAPLNIGPEELEGQGDEGRFASMAANSGMPSRT